jgi:hypothetical protein
MSGGALFLASAMVAIMGGSAVVGWLISQPGVTARRRARRRKLMRIPETAIAAVKHGDMVRLKGRAVACAPLLTSPLSQRPCIGFRLLVDVTRGEVIADRMEFASFVLADDTGEALMHAPFRVDLEPHDTRYLLSNQLRSRGVPAALNDLVKQSGTKVTTFGMPDQILYVETLLEPGDEIIAYGRATIEPPTDASARAPSDRGPRVRCHLSGTESPSGFDKPVVIADAKEPS